jgi:hypothetical protein
LDQVENTQPRSREQAHPYFALGDIQNAHQNTAALPKPKRNRTATMLAAAAPDF